MNKTLMGALAAALACCAGPGTFAQEKPPALEAPAAFRAFAKANCLACHNSKEAEGGFDLEDVLKGKAVSANPAAWHAALERIVARDMPPKGAKGRPTEDEYRRAEDWVRGQLKAHEAIAAAKQPRPMRRLSNAEYDRTVREVFGIAGISPSAAFPPDDAFDGFTNVAGALGLSTVLVEQYLAAGETVAGLAVLDGQQPKSAVRVYTPNHRDYGLTWRGHDPGGAMTKIGGADAWLGDHMSVDSRGPAGFYRVALHFTPRNLAARRGYTPHFHVRFGDELVAAGDVAVEEGKPAAFECLVATTGLPAVDVRFANGFPNNNSLRAASRPRRGSDGKPVWGTDNTWNFLEHHWKKGAAKNPDTPWPWPYLTDLRLEVEGPLFPDGWPLSRFQRENAKAIAAGDAKAVANWLLPRLYRRPATPEEVGGFGRFTAKAAAAIAADPKAAPEVAKNPFPAALRQAVARSLVSPHFLFHVEPGPVGRRLTDHELAARLSYFLWGGPPDDALTKLADAGKLRPALGEQARRLLADPRALRAVDRFTTEWLGLDRLGTVMPEAALYPRFDNQHLMRKDFADEPRAMMRHLLRENGSLFDLLDCDYAFLNDRLADHYHLPSLWSLWPDEREGFAPVAGGDLRKVTLPGGRRGGLVTTAAFLASTSENTRTSPVKRGAWVLEKLFNRPPPPPPPSVNAVLPDDGGGETAAAMVRGHLSAANCKGCHGRIDPLGLALEHYDAIGEWRDREPAWVDPANPARNRAAVLKRHKLDPAAAVPTFPIDDSFSMGGVEGRGADAVKNYLVANREKFARGFSEKLLVFALGRRYLITDEPELARVREAALKDRFQFRTLVLALIGSPLFQTR